MLLFKRSTCLVLMKHNLKKFKMLLSGVLVGCGLFHVLKHVVKNTHSWIVKQNQINCQNKNYVRLIPISTFLVHTKLKLELEYVLIKLELELIEHNQDPDYVWLILSSTFDFLSSSFFFFFSSLFLFFFFFSSLFLFFFSFFLLFLLFLFFFLFFLSFLFFFFFSFSFLFSSFLFFSFPFFLSFLSFLLLTFVC